MRQPTPAATDESLIRRFLGSPGDPDRARALVDPETRFIALRERSDEALPLYGIFVRHDAFATGRFEHRIRATDSPAGGHS